MLAVRDDSNCVIRKLATDEKSDALKDFPGRLQEADEIRMDSGGRVMDS